MKKANQEKTKKTAVIVGLVATGILAVTGIFLCLHKEEPVDYAAKDTKTPSKVIEVDTKTSSKVVEADTESVIPSPSSKPAEEKELAISTEAPAEQKGTEKEVVQPIQKEPKKTENEKPSKPPAEVVSAETGNEKTPPENKEIPAQTEPQSSNTADAPKHGTVQDGKIYLDGFGWVDYNGGETEVIQGDGIYENGNKIGIMD